MLLRPSIAVLSLALAGALAASPPARAQTDAPSRPTAKHHSMARGTSAMGRHGGDAQNGEVDRLNAQSLQRAQGGEDAMTSSSGSSGMANPTPVPAASPVAPAR